jgi:hypothetical protein
MAVLALVVAAFLQAAPPATPAPPASAPVTSAAPATSAAPTPGRANTRCQDSPFVPRLEGCTIRECVERDYDEAELQSGPVDRSGDFPRRFVEGQLSVLTYVCPEATSMEEIARRSLLALRRSGFGIVYSGDMYYTELPGFTVRKGREWVQVVSEPFDEGTGYTVTSVRAVTVVPPPRARPTGSRRGRKTTR